MFPSCKLFGLCPDWSTCRVFHCPFSHQPQPSTSSAPLPTSSTAAAPPTSALPQKRPAAPRSVNAAPPKRLEQARLARVQEPAQAASPALNANTAAAASQGTPKSAPPTAVANSGPPRLVPPRSLSHTPAVTRQKMINALYAQFLEIYTPGVLPSSLRQTLASDHALRQEEYLFSRSTKATYRNAIISALARLKKRPPARSADEAGTLEDEAERTAALAERERGRLTRKRVEAFVHPVDVLAQFDYVVSVPEGPGGDHVSEEGNTRKCERCLREFVVTSELSQDDREACHYHFGRMVTEKAAGVRQRVYSCCPSIGATPCQVGPHVFKDEKPSVLHSRVAFVPTSSLRRGLPSSASATPATAVDIVALDCELVYTTAGMSLARVTVLSGSGSVLLDEHVRPPTGVAVVDLNTRFSGVQEGDLDKAVLDVGGVQRALAQFVDAETIFVGHGLENDLKALRLVHTRVIDTAILFPHPNGGTWRHSLRNLTKDVLRKFIQEGDPTIGHSAKDDADAALELVRWKVKQHAAGKG
ncbi:hypothetical protein JCM8115_000093 [Rhodotorula mucilaginosa]|uniref:RNA exonuclease 3 n=1 Tax=Rhodotorula mucilaginosa TaxID=5537 RepID=A0A9P7B1F1_RHOMI|nr:RNA exonuclease 3 [Rhodotorula mucilaginosa]